MAHHRQSDDALGGLFRHGLKQAARAAECPPPDLLAAYFERALSSGETQRWESHFSSCNHCQEQLAALARIESAAGVAAAVPAARHASWMLDWRWLAPTFAAAGALTIWVALRQPSTDHIAQNKPAEAVSPSAPAATRTPEAPLPAPAKETAASSAGPAAKSDAPSADLVSGTSAKSDPGLRADAISESTSPAGFEAKAKLPATASSETAGARVALDEKSEALKKQAVAELADAGKKDATQDAKRAEEEKSRDPLAAQARDKALAQAPASQAIESRPAPSQQPPVQRYAETQVPREAVGALSANAERRARSNETQRQAAPGRAEAPPKQEEDGARHRPLRAMTVAPAFTAMAGRIQWRFYAGGLIERYDERLKSGDVAQSPAAPELLAASSPSEKVCWAVGRRGTILRSVNAAPWQVIGSPSDEDLIRIEARDEQTATVQTAAGKSYSTTDGGRTWRSQ